MGIGLRPYYWSETWKRRKGKKEWRESVSGCSSRRILSTLMGSLQAKLPTGVSIWGGVVHHCNPASKVMGTAWMKQLRAIIQLSPLSPPPPTPGALEGNAGGALA